MSSDDDHMESGDDCDYYNDSDDGEYYNDSDDGDMAEEKKDNAADDSVEKHYTFLSAADIRKLQEDDINHVSLTLSISHAEASRLLWHYRWNVTLVHDEWFADEEKLRNTVGILSRPIVSHANVRRRKCGICFDKYPIHELVVASCGHLFCPTCWEGYISTSINDGPGCLQLRCPEPSCVAAVSEDLISRIVSDEDMKKFSRFFVRSYIEDRKKTKWCPAPGCDHAVECDLDTDVYDVTCLCSHGFCWNCSEEAHRPVDCKTVNKWITKNSAESENVTWILANSKPCPKCQRPIEKNHGCMHMTCRPPCNFQFCWLCLEAWSSHGERSGGYYSCNGYEAAKKEGKFDEVEERRQLAKKSIEKYTHYYKRWASNESSRKTALMNFHHFQTEKLTMVSENWAEPESLLLFISEAWQQVIECRRVLKWTYAYGYYLPEDENAKRRFFEYLQGEAESNLERLHRCTETELYEAAGTKPPNVELQEYRRKLVQLTSVTRTYFEKLVKALENGLSDVNTKGQSSNRSPSRSARPDRDEIVDRWSCDRCTYSNPGSALTCQVCFIP